MLLKGAVSKISVIHFEYTTNSLSSWSKELAVNRKLRSTIISEKEDNPLRCTQVFENIFLAISVPPDFHPGISVVFGWFAFRSTERRCVGGILELFQTKMACVAAVEREERMRRMSAVSRRDPSALSALVFPLSLPFGLLPRSLRKMKHSGGCK